jgi:CheY-like chemotaxis protein
MYRIQYVHWNEEEAAVHAERLRQLGFVVDHEPAGQPGFRTRLRLDPPDAVVIDLSRLPSHGREIGQWLTETRSTQAIPLIFLGGSPDKVSVARQQFPGAHDATWESVVATVEHAIRLAATAPGKAGRPAPASTSATACSGKPLLEKLGIRDRMTVCILNAPPPLSGILQELPPGTTLRTRLQGKFDLLIWFPRGLRDFEDRIGEIARKTPSGGVWIAWPKQSSGVHTHPGQRQLREAALASGLVDYRVCSIDSTWSALKFAPANRQTS